MEKLKGLTKLNPGKSNFLNTSIEKVCSSDDLRPAMQCVYFNNGYVYATNAHIAIKQKLSLHGFTEDEIALLNGKLLHKDHLKIMKRCDYFIITTAGIESTKGLLKIIHKFSDDIYPDIDAVIPNKEEGKSVTQIAINPLILKTVSDALFHSTYGVDMNFFGNNKPIILHTSAHPLSEQFAIIMPLAINEKL